MNRETVLELGGKGAKPTQNLTEFETNKFISAVPDKNVF